MWEEEDKEGHKYGGAAVLAPARPPPGEDGRLRYIMRYI